MKSPPSGAKIYEGIREEMEANHWGELVVIDIHSGDYEVGEYTRPDKAIWKSPIGCAKRQPRRLQTWAELVGYGKSSTLSETRLGWRGNYFRVSRLKARKEGRQ